MPCLGDFVCVREKLKSSSRAAVVALHKFVFEGEGDRGNRGRLRQFEGFGDNEENYKTKEKFVKENLSAADLVCVCNLLNIDYNKDDLFDHIYINLREGQLLCSRSFDDVDDDDYDHDDDDDDNLENTIVQNNNEQTTTAGGVLKVYEGGASSLSIDVYEHNDGSKRQAIPNSKLNDECGQKALRREDNFNNYNDGNMQQRREDNFNNYNDGNMQQRRENNIGNYNDGIMQQRREDNPNDYNDGYRQQRRESNLDNYNGEYRRQASRRNEDFDNYNDGYVQQTTRRGFTMSFRDIEDSIRSFDGTSVLPINAWIEEFEETAAVMGWDELQRFVFAKKSLKGVAKLFISSEKGITTYDRLKNALLDEFETRTSGIQLHKMLSERKMKKDENVHEYYLKMKELAARGDIDYISLMQYVIDGIADSDVNKMILYGANNSKDFKDKLRCYEIMDKSTAKRTMYTKKNEKDLPKDRNFELKCFNCGGKGHKSNDCNSKSKGTKCFNCEKFGHISKDCPQKKGESNVRLLNKHDEDMMVKEIKIGDLTTNALFDTGSKFNIMSKSIFNELESSLPECVLTESNFHLSGFGHNRKNNLIKPIGNIDFLVTVDEDDFELTFHVVPDNCMDVDVVLGKPLCLLADVRITPEGFNITKFTKDNNIHMMMKIDLAEKLDLDIDVTASERARVMVTDMIGNYKPAKSKTTNVEMRIVLKDDTPIYCNPRRLPLKERTIVEDQIEEWLKEDIIEPSESEFCSPIVLAKKRDSTARLCVDFRRMNKVIVKDRYPLPLIEDQLDRLQKAKIFSTIDLRNGFFHVSVHEDSKKFTSFVTHNGQYQFKKVPFGLSNSPGVFQRHVNAIFRDLTREGVALPYVDDVIIPAENENDALKNLQKVLQLCKDYGLDVNTRKCHFLKRRIQFLGHVIEDQKISPSPDKTAAMIKYPVPRNMKQLESFLGLAGYFRKFIPNFSIIAKPLTDLKKKNAKFKFDDEQIIAFETLKNTMSDGPVLRIYNPDFETEVHTDASIDGYGAVLLQKSPDDDLLHPIYYMSKRTTDPERKYTSYELEVLAVIEALKKFRVYLIGVKFKLVTDCNAFTKTLDKKGLSTRVARWILFLQEYDYIVEHRPGTQMRHVDALSRNPIMMITQNDLVGKIVRLQAQDEDLNTIKDILSEKSTYKDYLLKSNILYKIVDDFELLVVPKGMQNEIIRKAHEKGHFSTKKTKELIGSEYYIPRLDEKVNKCIANCIPCVMANRKRGRQEGELHPIPKEDVPLHTYHVDYLGPLESTSKMYKHIFAVIDSFTKFCWLYPTKTTSAKDAITRLQMQSAIFGNPFQIISDRGSAFTSDDFRMYCEDENINHILITTGLPRANGQIERLNSTIISVLAKLSIENPAKWYQFVNQVQQMINSTYHRSINTTPFQLLVGSKMRSKDDIQLKELIEAELIANFDDQRNELRDAAKQQILKVQSENCKTFNRKRKPAFKYKVDDLVAIKRTQLGGGLKLKAKYLGPYKIAKVKPNDTYDVLKYAECEGPKRTTTCAEYMKPWPDECYDDEDDDFDDTQDGRDVGMKLQLMR